MGQKLSTEKDIAFVWHIRSGRGGVSRTIQEEKHE
jgi:hypothetical protein